MTQLKVFLLIMTSLIGGIGFIAAILLTYGADGLAMLAAGGVVTWITLGIWDFSGEVSKSTAKNKR